MDTKSSGDRRQATNATNISSDGSKLQNCAENSKNSVENFEGIGYISDELPKREGFIMYRSFVEAVADFDDATKGSIYEAIAHYALDGIVPELSGVAKTIFVLVKPQIDANERRRQNGLHGGAPKGNQNARKQPKNNQKQSKENVNVKEKDNDKEKDKDNNMDCLLFEKCWSSYKCKGNKERALKEWYNLTDTDKEIVLPHIRAYVPTKDERFLKNFENYLHDGIFLQDVVKDNITVFKPILNDLHYYPSGFHIWLNEETGEYHCWANFDGSLFDGYTDEERPDGAKIVLNNARGTIVWSKEQQKWNNIDTRYRSNDLPF